MKRRRGSAGKSEARHEFALDGWQAIPAHGLFHLRNELGVAPAADFDLVVMDGDEGVSRGGDELLIGIDFGALVPEADGFGSCEGPSEEKCQEEHKRQAAEDVGDAA